MYVPWVLINSNGIKPGSLYSGDEKEIRILNYLLITQITPLSVEPTYYC